MKQQFDNRKSMTRYTLIAVVMGFIAVAVLGRAFYVMTAERSYWLAVAAQVKRIALSSSLQEVISSALVVSSWRVTFQNIAYIWISRQYANPNATHYGTMQRDNQRRNSENSVRGFISYFLHVPQKSFFRIWRKAMRGNQPPQANIIGPGQYGNNVFHI